MESDRPMDRLLCGDVGFGKTELALRAAFKAAMSGKQVALLAPTTVLAQQHFHVFRERLAKFPVVGRDAVALRRRRDAGAHDRRHQGRARSTSWSAPTGCCSATSASSGSGC